MGGGPRSQLVLFVVLSALLSAAVLPLPRVAGSFDDDGLYLLGARSIARGTSYRALHLPGEPYQTKYPPLVPLALAGILRVSPDFPGNLPWLLLPNVLAAAGAACLWRRLLRDAFGLPDAAAVALCAGALLSRANAGLAGATMAEMPFALLASAAIVTLASGRAAAAPLAGLWAGLATLARVIGVSLGAGLGLYLLARRRWADFGRFAAVYAAVLAPWLVWRHAAARANGALAADPAYAYDLDYASWILGPAEELRVVWINAVQSAFGFAVLALGGSVAWARALFDAGAPGVAAVWVIALAVAGGMALGAWRARDALRRHPLGPFLAAYLVLVLAWPFETFRFFLPFLAAIPALLALGIAALAPAPRQAQVQTAVAVSWAAVSAASLGVWLVAQHAPPPDGDVARRLRLLDAVRAHTRPGEVIASSQAPMVTLYTGRQSLRLWSHADPRAEYAGGRDLARFYLEPGEEELERSAGPAEARAWLAALRRAGVERFVLCPGLDVRPRDAAMHAWTHRLGLPGRPIDEEPFATFLIELRGPRLEALLAGEGP